MFLRDDPFWVRLVSDDRLLDIAELFVGPDLALFASHYISKPPYSGQPVLWHQDAAFWPLDPMEVVTLWLAVDHSTPENGCVRVIPGSHRPESPEMRDNTSSTVLGKEIAVEVDESQAVDIVLRPATSRCTTRTSSTAVRRTPRHTDAADLRSATSRRPPGSPTPSARTRAPSICRGPRGEQLPATPALRRGPPLRVHRQLRLDLRGGGAHSRQILKGCPAGSA